MAVKGELRRGDCVFVQNDNAVGYEIKKSRHAVVVSNPVVCMTSKALQVVYISKNPKRDMPCHVRLDDGRTVLCEQIATVDLSRLEWTGPRLSRHEMCAINAALKRQLMLDAEHEWRLDRRVQKKVSV